MPARHRSRQRALQVLFLLDLRQQNVDLAIASYYDTLHTEDESPKRADRDEFMESLVHGTTNKAKELDEQIEKRSDHWRIERMPAVDRNILRLAIYEMTEQATPAAVVIDESLELARQFSGDESVAFINGVLDAVRKGLPASK